MATKILEQPTTSRVQTILLRFDRHQRIQHFVLMASFILLAFSGLSLKWHDLGISQWWVAVLGGMENNRGLHHFSAWAMVLVCAYHAIYILTSIAILKRPFPYQMIPQVKDFVDFKHDLQYYFGLRKSRGRYDRFNYREKFDYWAIFWGMPVMGGSGFILMFPVFASKLLPNWAIPIALVAHSDEAVLAVGWIFIVHMFFAHLAPSVFPFNKTIFTGKTTFESYQHEHPVEYERIIAETSD